MMRKGLFFLFVCIVGLGLPSLCKAQTWAVRTNLADWAMLGTINVGASAAVERHFTIDIDARVNPWTLTKDHGTKQMQHKHQSYGAGFRWWPWYVYSGWFLGVSAQYSEYNLGGVFRKQTEQGDAGGLRLSAGYSLMLAKHFNMEFGAAFWGGYKTYTLYACPRCGRIVGGGSKWFFMPADIMVSFVWTF